MRLITIEERQRNNKIDEYLQKMNIALIITLIILCFVILIGWIFW